MTGYRFGSVVLGIAMAAGLCVPTVLAEGAGYEDHPESLIVQEPSVGRQVRAMENFRAAVERLDFTGDADFDFVLYSIPYMRAVIDFAEIVTEFGSDPELVEMADVIVETWGPELERLQVWLAARGPE